MAEDCLAGGGELGELMRAKDWSTTPLGPVASWPQSLRTSVSIMLSSGFAVVVAWGPEFIFLYNDRYRPILGATKHPAALGSRSSDIFPEVWDSIGPLFQKTRAGETVAVDDFLIPLDRNGYLEECFFTLSYSPIRDESGGVGGMLAIVAETTERVQGERRLRTLRDLAIIAPRAQRADDACQNAVSVLAHNPTDVPFALLFVADDEHGTARLVGRTGVPAGVADDPGLWRLDDGARSGHTVVVSDLERRFGILPGGAYPEPTHTAVVLPLARPGGEQPYGFFVAGVSPRRSLDDRYQGFFELAAEHVATAITNALAHEAEQKRAEALAEIDRAKTAFFSNVSHEFRTPLTLMLAPIEELIARGESHDQVALIHRNALRLLKLVNSLLDFSRIEAGRAEAVFAPTDLAALTRDIASSFRSATDRAGLELAIDCPPLRDDVYVDRDMWEKILLNLLSNAFKFTFEGAIRVRLRDRGTSVELDVEDTGTGIAEHDLPRLFERFHRIEGARSRSYEGSGIGLALVQELVRMHGGTVSVRSQPGLGTTFTVAIPYGTYHLPADRVRGERTLASTALGPAPYVEQALRWLPDDPIAEPDLPALPDASRSPVPRTTTPGSASRSSIAIVDDNADMRAYLARVLTECGDARAYADGRAALAGIRARPPDLVVTDVMMPNIDGFGLLQALRGDATTQAIPVIMLSARAGEEARIEGVRAGADDYIVKPFSARELVARVGAQLGLARLRGVAAAERAALHRLYMDAPAAIAIVSGPEHVYELANPLYCKIVGRSVEQLIGRSGRDAMPEFVPQGIWDLFDRIRATGERFRAATFPTEIHRDGRLTRSFFNWLGEPSFDDTGQVARILIFAVDVTEEVVARERAEQLTVELQRANRTKDEFFAMLGHELRNPLAPISTALRVMELRGVQGGERERAVIGRQVDHLTRLVDDLLDISRITTGKVQLASTVVEMADIVTGAIEVTSPMLEQRTQRLRMVVPRPGLAVCVDTARMTQVVSNLLVNASKYSDPGTEIRISAALEHDEVVLHVDDAGIGIDPEMLPRVFDVFSQEQQTLARSSGGLGLGLAIVRSLVTMHGGNVSAHSAGRGKGATFTVRLPHAPQHVSALAGASELAAPAPQRASARRILIVDDNPDASAMLSDLLGALGHVIQTAHDGPSALAMLDAFRPEIALLDLGLPVMDGYELARAMRASPAAAGARLYAVSGYGQERDRARTKDAGFDAHFVKPVDLDAIVRAFEQPDS